MMSDAERRVSRLFEILGEGSENAVRMYITEACAAERERCAKIAEQASGNPEARLTGIAIALAIRKGK